MCRINTSNTSDDCDDDGDDIVMRDDRIPKSCSTFVMSATVGILYNR
jgi:hypothetical protein